MDELNKKDAYFLNILYKKPTISSNLLFFKRLITVNDNKLLLFHTIKYQPLGWTVYFVNKSGNSGGLV